MILCLFHFFIGCLCFTAFDYLHNELSLFIYIMNFLNCRWLDLFTIFVIVCLFIFSGYSNMFLLVTISFCIFFILVAHRILLLFLFPICNYVYSAFPKYFASCSGTLSFFHWILKNLLCFLKFLFYFSDWIFTPID